MSELDIILSLFIMFDKWLKDVIDVGIFDFIVMMVVIVDVSG